MLANDAKSETSIPKELISYIVLLSNNHKITPVLLCDNDANIMADFNCLTYYQWRYAQSNMDINRAFRVVCRCDNLDIAKWLSDKSTIDFVWAFDYCCVYAQAEFLDWILKQVPHWEKELERNSKIGGVFQTCINGSLEIVKVFANNGCNFYCHCGGNLIVSMAENSNVEVLDYIQRNKLYDFKSNRWLWNAFMFACEISCNIVVGWFINNEFTIPDQVTIIAENQFDIIKWTNDSRYYGSLIMNKAIKYKYIHNIEIIYIMRGNGYKFRVYIAFDIN